MIILQIMGKAVLAALIAGIAIKLFLVDIVIAEGISMEPAIKSGTVLLVNRLQYGLRFPGGQHYLLRWAAPEAGEVVVFYTPEGNLAVKRCTGFPRRGLFFALGDNSPHSYDSRFYGPVATENIVGKALGIK